MLLKRTLLASLSMALVATACGGGSAPEGEVTGDALQIDADVVAAQPSGAATAAAAAANAFGRRLHVALSSSPDAELNVVTSPFSAAAALALIAGGTDGVTADEFVEVLGLDAVRDERWASLLTEVSATPDAQVTIANAIWADDGGAFADDYVDFARSVFGATAETVDLGAQSGADAIDTWVRESTNDLIDGIAEDLGLPKDSTNAVLANATYFLGDWTTPFDPDDTAPGPFTRADGTTVEVPFMVHDGKGTEVEGVRVAYGQDVTFIELAYGSDGSVVMEVLLPAPGGDPVALLDDFDPEDLDELRAGAFQLGAELLLPRFEVEWRSPLDDVLQELGIQAAYSGGFGPMGFPGSFLSTVVQATYIRVDEAGTEAAAVTAGAVDESAAEVIAVDRPFAFVIREVATGAELFVGTIGDPTA